MFDYFTAQPLKSATCLALFISAGYAQDLAVQSARQSNETGRHAIAFNGAPSIGALSDSDNSRVLTIATADFDKRNGPDLATVQSDGVLNVFLNNGRGNLEQRYTNTSAVTLNPSITYIEQSDLNGDGYADVVAMDPKNSAFLVFINHADGTFTNAVSVNVASPAGARLAGGGLTVADVNADGKPDVVTLARKGAAGSTTFSQLTFLGIGDGSFKAAIAVETPLAGDYSLTSGRSLATADMNHDGKPDLVLQIQQSSPRQGISVNVSLGNGDGSFSNIPIPSFVASAGPQPASNLTVGDVNNDGTPDVVFLTYSNQVFVALGQNDGSLQTPSSVLSAMSGAVISQFADFNTDGNLDLVVFGSGQLGVFTGRGDGTFQRAGQYTGGYGIHQQPEPVDFDGDGNLDIAWLDYTNARIGLYFGKRDGSFAAAHPIEPANPDDREWAANIQVITAGDFNRDGAQDVLAYRSQHASAGGPADLYTGLNIGRGKFSFQRALPAGRVQELAKRYGSFTIDSTSADFNGDRIPDVILKTQNGLALLLANRDRTLNPDPLDVTFPVAVGCNPFNYISNGDMNNDGFEDLVIGYAQRNNCPASASTPSGFFVLLGNGKGQFDARFTAFGNAIYFVRVADLNRDRRPDLVFADSIPGKGFTLYVAPGDGFGAFNLSAATVPLSGQFISDILIGDYNDDRRPDLALSTAGEPDDNGAPQPASSGILLLPSYGNFEFGNATKVLAGVSSIWNGTAFGDFNRDGKPDLVLSTYSKAEQYRGDFGMIVLPNKGDGGFGQPQSEMTPLGVSGRNTTAFVSDFNRDGLPDILLGNGASSPLWLNTSNVRPQ